MGESQARKREWQSCSPVQALGADAGVRRRPDGRHARAGQFRWLDNDYKIIYYRDYEQALADGFWDNEVFQSLSREFELYNVVEDPTEKNNLIAQEPELALQWMAPFR